MFVSWFYYYITEFKRLTVLKKNNKLNNPGANGETAVSEASSVWMDNGSRPRSI